jgi:hypothetical protein
MAGIEMKNAVVIALIVMIVLFIIYQYDPSFFGVFGMREGFDSPKMNEPNYKQGAAPGAAPGGQQKKQNEGAASVNAMAPGNPQSKDAAGNELKVQPKESKEGFADITAYEGPAEFGSAVAPAGCYPRDQLTPSELLPKDMNSVWPEQNPMVPGSLKGKNFLSAGALIGVNTVGQSLRNANLQVRSEPPCPQVPVSIFNQSTISPDISHRPLEIGS